MGGNDWVEQARADAQAHVPEEIAAVGFLQPAGSWGAFGMSKVNPMAGTLQQRGANKRAKGLAKAGGFKPKVAMLAVAADNIYVFSSTPARRGTMKVGEQLAIWARDEITITVAPGRVAAQVTVDVPQTGDRFELEATLLRGFNDAFLEAVATPT